MPRSCGVCSHEKRYDIDSILAERSKSYRAIALQYGVSKDAVSRHVSGSHISELIALAADAERAAHADSLLDRLEGLQAETQAVLDEVKETDLYGARLGAIREMRRNLELIGEVTKELNRTPTLNLVSNPEYIEVRNAIVLAVEQYPEAAQAISRAMLEIEGNGDR